MGFFRNFFGRGTKSSGHANAFPASPEGAEAACLADPELNAVLSRDGIVTFPWLSPERVEQLKAVVAKATEGVDLDGVHIPTPTRISAFNNDAAYKSRLYDGIYAFLKDDLEVLLPGYEPMVINAFEKSPGRGSDEVPVHQNPSFVEEPRQKSVSVWIPLQAVGKHNGTLGILRGSHKRFNTMRAANMPYKEIFEPVAQQLEEEAFEPLDLAIGEIAVADDSIIHWSYPNLSGQPRHALQLIMVPRDTPHIYYFYDEAGPRPVMELYDVDKDFFFVFNCTEKPTGLKKIGTVPYEYLPVTQRDLFGTAQA